MIFSFNFVPCFTIRFYSSCPGSPSSNGHAPQANTDLDPGYSGAVAPARPNPCSTSSCTPVAAGPNVTEHDPVEGTGVSSGLAVLSPSLANGASTSPLAPSDHSAIAYKETDKPVADYNCAGPETMQLTPASLDLPVPSNLNDVLMDTSEDTALFTVSLAHLPPSTKSDPNNLEPRCARPGSQHSTSVSLDLPAMADTAMLPTISPVHSPPSMKSCHVDAVADAQTSPIAPLCSLPTTDVCHDDAESVVSLGSPGCSPRSVVADLGGDEALSCEGEVSVSPSRYLRIVLLAVTEPWSVVESSLFRFLPPSCIPNIACIVQTVTTAGQTVWLAASSADAAVTLRGYLADRYLLPGVRLGCEFVSYSAYHDASSRATNQWLPTGVSPSEPGLPCWDDAHKQQPRPRLADPGQCKNPRQEPTRNRDIQYSRTASCSRPGHRGRSPRRRQPSIQSHPPTVSCSSSADRELNEERPFFRRATCFSRSPIQSRRSTSASRGYPYRTGRSRSLSPRSRRPDRSRRSPSPSDDRVYNVGPSRMSVSHFDHDSRFSCTKDFTSQGRYYHPESHRLLNPLPVHSSEPVWDNMPFLPIPFLMNPFPSFNPAGDLTEPIRAGIQPFYCSPLIMVGASSDPHPNARRPMQPPGMLQHGSFPTYQPAALPIFQRAGVRLNDRIECRADRGEGVHGDNILKRVHSPDSYPRKRGKRGGVKHKLELESDERL